MRTRFADSFFFYAFLDRNDEAHSRAAEVFDDLDTTILTTAWVLLEVANGFAGARNRAKFVDFAQFLRSSEFVVIVPADQGDFEEAMRLYADRLDKEWSLTDCTSFVVMKKRGLTEALTGDHHFEQAGFIALLK
jgi:predicted nucleic acid-binding protein